MAFSKNDNKEMSKTAQNSGYRENSSGNGWVKNDGSFLKSSSSNDCWNVNGSKYTFLSDAKKSGRL